MPTPKEYAESMSDPIIVNSTELVSLPDWDIYNIKARLDTGAELSTIDTSRIKELNDGRILFTIVLNRNKNYKHTIIDDIEEMHTITSSNGESEKRFIVKTTMDIKGYTSKARISLTSRKRMDYRLLVGRQALEGYLVKA